MAIPGKAAKNALDVGRDDPLTDRATARLRALDAMLGGVAHDLNNALSVVLMNLDIMQQDAALNGKHARRIDGMLDATANASALVRHLLNFSHSRRPDPEVVSVVEVLPPLIELIEVAVGKEVEIVVDSGDVGPCCILVDAASFEVAIVYAALQLATAMPGGGVLNIGLDKGEAPDDQVVLTLQAEALESEPRGNALDRLDLAIVEHFARDAQGRMSAAAEDQLYRIVIQLPACPETTTV